MKTNILTIFIYCININLNFKIKIMKTKLCPTCKENVDVLELTHIECKEIEWRLIGHSTPLKLIPFYCCSKCGTLFIPLSEMKKNIS